MCDNEKNRPVSIRCAGFQDARAVFQLIKSYPEELIPRSMSSIIQNIDRFVVAEADGGLVGTGAWAILPEVGDADSTCVEIQSVAVARGYRHHKIGTTLIEALLDRVRSLNPAQVVVLTFSPPFFEKMGFREVPKASLMHKIYMGCVNCPKHENPFTCPEVAMALDRTANRE